MIKVAVIGACGRMGSSIIKALQSRANMKLVCAVESEHNPYLGKDVGEAVGIERRGVKLVSSTSLDETLKDCKPAVLVDFTNANAAVDNMKTAARNSVNLVIGTTGFSEKQSKEIEAAIKEAGVSAVVSPNMATGVNVFFKIAQAAAGILKDYEVEIIEAHHRFKKDSPSGTALRVGELIVKELDGNLEESAVYGRKGAGQRPPREIGFHSIRAGDIVGEHTVLYAGEGERLEITHRAHSRDPFVRGAIDAIEFVDGKKDGKIYNTWDVLGIS
ncbi:MAG: 4-hydroxy-tetrahydrodipicolinate reductase [Candidatus Hydrothermarchaeales archaeon]